MKSILAISSGTYRELYRAKIIPILLGFFFAMLLLGTFFGTVSVGDTLKVIKDFGLFCASLFSVGVIIISGTSLLEKELKKKTIYNILSKPISRGSLVLGKFLGMLCITATLIALMAFILIVYVYFFQGNFDGALAIGAFHMFIEGLIMCAGALFFSSIATSPLLAGLFSVALFIAGRNVGSLLHYFNSPEISGSTKGLLNILYWILPHFHQISIINRIVYGQVPPLSYTMWCLSYGLGYALLLLTVSFFLFNRREFN